MRLRSLVLASCAIIVAFSSSSLLAEVTSAPQCCSDSSQCGIGEDCYDVGPKCSTDRPGVCLPIPSQTDRLVTVDKR
jgi:hypothetical protein